MSAIVTGRRIGVCLLVAVCLVLAGLAREPRAGEAAADWLVVEIGERHGSGVHGQAVLTTLNGLTTATVELQAGDETYLPYLRRGTCDRFQPEPAVPLAVVAAGAPSRTTIDIPLETLDGRFVIALYRLGGAVETLLDPGTSVACGQIGSAPAEPALVAPPVSGIGIPRGGDGFFPTLALGCGVLAIVVAMLGVSQRGAARRIADEGWARAAADRLQRYV